ncbi:MAG: Arc family DNA-binding protein [Gluconobacter oxydans]|uniref:Arc family DNA-binding protein n=1 Tax=Gluconobacter oxydans TaxID=442 RepID=UPI0039EB3130
MSDESRSTFTLRTSRALLDRLKAAADEHSHSMNAEIVQRIESSFSKEGEGKEIQKELENQKKLSEAYRELCENFYRSQEDLRVFSDSFSLMALGFLDEALEKNTNADLVAPLKNISLILKSLASSVRNEKQVRSILQEGEIESHAPEEFIQRIIRSLGDDTRE